jgi:hypothetical protein
VDILQKIKEGYGSKNVKSTFSSSLHHISIVKRTCCFIALQLKYDTYKIPNVKSSEKVEILENVFFYLETREISEEYCVLHMKAYMYFLIDQVSKVLQ